jgi:hypothetical protein
VVDTVKSFAKLYPQYAADVANIIAHLESKETFKALKVAHSLLEQHEKSTKATMPVAAPMETIPA